VDSSYQAFLDAKRLIAPSAGREVDPDDLHPSLFGFQRDLVRWALRKGRAALFADTGLGKTRMQLEWARHSGQRTLILAPLAVTNQTIREAATVGLHDGLDIAYAREAGPGLPDIVVTNYEMLDRFDPASFGAVVLDESSILKAYDGKTRTRIIEAFADTPMRLACTATPAPNDIAELANHAEFLGVLSRVEMLATFFVHDDKGWRLKGHAREPFWRWLASWGMSLRRPSDLGYPDDGYLLPPLRVHRHVVDADWSPDGQLFAYGLGGITDRAAIRKSTLVDRADFAAEVIGAKPDEQWLVWCGLNDEANAITERVEGAVNVEGSWSPDAKADALTRFADGRLRVLVTKPSIAGFGMNFQACAQMVFLGLSDSFEQYYQATRRCWRFGQTHPVDVHVVISDPERVVFDNVLRKEQEALQMQEELVGQVAAYEQAEVAQAGERMEYATDAVSGPDWTLLLGDSAERLAELPDQSVDLSIFSPPFQSLYVYSPTERDLGNSASPDQFWTHYGYISAELLRVTRPGRNVCVHVAQVTTTKAGDGVIGLRDFRGDMIRHMTDAGFVYHGEVCIDKDPQAQAIRTHSKSLLFVQLRKDASWLRPALADYVLVFRAPGDNQVPVKPDISNEEWIEWARPIWYGIRESDTLNVRPARSADDERHICPLQLGTIERCVRLWSNKGETVLDPFAGIGSTGFEALRHDRRFVGVELKPEYFNVARGNLSRAGSADDRLPFEVNA
jgi:DNA modification methylase/superfamily II DNA or RNA helicase